MVICCVCHKPIETLASEYIDGAHFHASCGEEFRKSCGFVVALQHSRSRELLEKLKSAT